MWLAFAEAWVDSLESSHASEMPVSSFQELYSKLCARASANASRNIT